ncbi:hypothetical protein THRCLA_20333, partial [Thraustotheca clavata]
APKPTTPANEARKPQDILDSNQREAKRLSRHVEGVKLLERSLTAAKRVGDPNLMQDICIFAWNVALPLLEPHLRKHVHRLFQAATALLEELDSPLVQLRAQMHLETAKCEMMSDYLAKASVHVNKALVLDYGESATTPPHEDAGHKTNKPSTPDPSLTTGRQFDKFLLPLKQVLDLKSNLYGEPEAVEDQAIIFVEQSKESHDKHMKLTCLNKAIALLDPIVDTPSLDMNTVKKRFALWHDIATFAWGVKMVEMTRKGAGRAHKYEFGLNDFQTVQQAELHFILAETYTFELQELKQENSFLDARLGVIVKSASEDVAETWNQCKRHVIQEILLGLQMGLDTKANHVVYNAAIYLWNYHFGLFKNPKVHLDTILPELVAAQEKVFHALLGLEASTSHHLPLLSCIAQSMTFLYERKPTEMENACDVVLKRDGLPILHRKALIEIKTQIQLDRGAKDATVGDSVPMKVISCLKQLDIQMDLFKQPVEDEKVQLEKTLSLFQKASSLWLPFATENFASSENSLEAEQQKREFHAEVWVRLAKAGVFLQRTHEAQKYCEIALSPLQASDIPSGLLVPCIWRWYSLAQTVWAQAILQLANGTETQEKDIQHELAVFAVQHLVLGADFGVRSGNPKLIENAAMVMWNGILDILDTNATSDPSYRRKLLPDLEKMLNHVNTITITKDWSFRLELVCALLDIYEELQLWEPGLATVDAAFATIPANLQRPLWQYRIIFLSKLGKSVQDGFAKMKDNDVLLQARVAKRIAASSTDPAAQYKALYRTVKDLTGLPEQAQFQVEIAEWLYTNQFPLDDVHDQLHSAMGIILPIICKDFAGTNDKNATKRSKGKKKKEDVVDIQWWHLDLVLRYYVMLAMAARTYAERLECVIIALAHVKKIWHILSDEMHLMDLQEAFKTYQETPTEATKVEDFNVWREQNNIPPTFILPTTTQEWANFDLEQYFPRLCGETPIAKLSSVALQPENVPQPTLTLFYLMKLRHLASDFCLHSHLLPLLQLCIVVVYGTRSSSTSTMPALGDISLMPIVLDLHFSTVLEELEMVERSNFYLKRSIDTLRLLQPQSGAISEKIAVKSTTSSLRHRKQIFSKQNGVELCLELAEALLSKGFHLQVKQFLAILSNLCQNNEKNLARTDYCYGKLLFCEGEHYAALGHLKSSVCTPNLDVVDYTQYVIEYSNVLCAMTRLKDAKTILAGAITNVSQLQRIPLSPVARALEDGGKNTSIEDLDSIQSLSQLQAAYAHVLTLESHQLYTTGGDWQPLWAEASNLYSESSHRLLPLGGNFVMVDIATTYGRILLNRGLSLSDIDTDPSSLEEARKQLLLAHSYIESIWTLLGPEPVLQKLFSNIKFHLGLTEVAMGRIMEETNMVVYQIESDAQKNLIELWLERTAPKKQKNIKEMEVPTLQKASLFFTSCSQLDSNNLLSQIHLGQCLRLNLPLEYQNSVWSYTNDSLRKQGISNSSNTSHSIEPRVDDIIRYLTTQLANAVKNQHREGIERCTYELFQCYGCNNSQAATKYLLWYQSCYASVHAESVFSNAAEPTNRTKLFMQRVQSLSATSIPGQLARLYLDSQSEAWRRLQVHQDIDIILGQLPPNYSYLCLQLSLDGRYLFGSLNGSMLARMELHRPRRVALKELISKVKSLRISGVKQLLQYSDLPHGETDEFEYLDTTQEDPLEAQFQSLVADAKTLFGSFLALFNDGIPKSTKDDQFLVLLVDPRLEAIPFETMVDAIDARDLSIHFLAQRYTSLKVHPFKRDDMVYIADPRHDDPSESPTSITTTLSHIKSTPSFQWKGLTGQKSVPSAGEWQSMLTMRHGGGLLFYGPNRMLAHFPPQCLAGLNVLKCNLIWCSSRMENYSSYRRQSKMDTHKSKEALAMEDSYTSMVLYSLAGVNCIVMNQWATSFLANHRNLTTSFAQLAKNVPLSKALKRVGDVWYTSKQTKGAGRGVVKSLPLKGRIQYNCIVYGVPTL